MILGIAFFRDHSKISLVLAMDLMLVKNNDSKSRRVRWHQKSVQDNAQSTQKRQQVSATTTPKGKNIKNGAARNEHA